MTIHKKSIAAAAVALLFASGVATAQRTAGENVDDATLTSQTKLALIGDEAVGAGHINVESYKGEVLLIGWVDSDAEKKAALARAEMVDNVRDVDDALRVKPGKRSFGRVIDDETLHAALKLRLAQVEGLSTVSDVIVQVHSGEAIIGGFVDSKDTASDIAEALKGVDGLDRMHNELRVKD